MMKAYNIENITELHRIRLSENTIPEMFRPPTPLTLMSTAVQTASTIEIALETNGSIGVLFGTGVFSFGTLTYSNTI